MNIDKQYNFNDDAEIYQKWLRRTKHNNEEFAITLPPPNITGILHMGHVLNCTIQDILIRWKHLCGYNTTWIPGIDHAGISCQFVIEKQLKIENKTRFDIGKENFIKRIWDWKEQNGSIIFNQIKELGCLCDWDNNQFTMDDFYQKTVEDTFIKLYNDHLIYR